MKPHPTEQGFDLRRRYPWRYRFWYSFYRLRQIPLRLLEKLSDRMW